MTSRHGTDVVLGAGSGMGAAVAAPLAGRRRLLLADRDPEAAARVAAALPGEVDVVACDITSSSDVGALVAATGTLSSLVLTAGLSPTMAGGTRIIEVNLVAADRVVRAFEPIVELGSA